MRFTKEGLVLREYSLFKPREEDLNRIVSNQSLYPDRIIKAEWWGDRGDTLATATTMPHRHKGNLQELNVISRAFSGANKVLLLKIVL